MKSVDEDSTLYAKRHSEPGMVQARCQYAKEEYHFRASFLKEKPVGNDGLSPLQENGITAQGSVHVTGGKRS